MCVPYSNEKKPRGYLETKRLCRGLHIKHWDEKSHWIHNYTTADKWGNSYFPFRFTILNDH